MSREQEMEDKRRRRLQRWYKKLPLHLRQIDPVAVQKLKDEGFLDADNRLTPAGELRMLQLETLEWMVLNTPEIRKQRSLKRAAARKMKP